MFLELRPTLQTLRPYHWIYLIVTWFHSGRIRPASGSWGSLATLPFSLVILSVFGSDILFITAIILFFVGTYAISCYLTHTDHKDPPEIVIDEVVGVCLYMAFLPKIEWQLIVVSFILFRLLDSLKPGPIGWIDRYTKGSFGVMADDILAALLTLLIVYGLNFFGFGI